MNTGTETTKAISVFFCAKAGASASDALIRRFGRLFSPASDLSELIRPQGKKPYFPRAPKLYFSVSHAGSYWACAFSQAPVGLDIEGLRPYRPGIPRRFFHPAEAAWLEDRPQEDFFTIWTAKEACVKLWGCGIDESFRHFSVLSPRQAEGAEKDGFSGGLVLPPPGKDYPPAYCLPFFFQKGYCSCLAALSPENFELHFF